MALPSIDVPLTRLRAGQTQRRDSWWVAPGLTFVILSGFIVYATWAALQNGHYESGNYLSPFYSPLLFTTTPGWVPSWLPFSPALLILWAPAGFRLTCYYYRGAYYKGFWADPPNCAVGEPRKKYLGERFFPLILQNAHRFFLYLALGFIVILGIDAVHAMIFPSAGGGHQFGIGVGTIILTLNVILLGGYTLGCHSLRHLVGGGKDILSDKPVRKTCYECVSALNKRHMLFAWMSLFCVAGSDVYVRLCSMGVISDFRIL